MERKASKLKKTSKVIDSAVESHLHRNRTVSAPVAIFCDKQKDNKVKEKETTIERRRKLVLSSATWRISTSLESLEELQQPGLQLTLIENIPAKSDTCIGQCEDSQSQASMSANTSQSQAHRSLKIQSDQSEASQSNAGRQPSIHTSSNTHAVVKRSAALSIDHTGARMKSMNLLDQSGKVTSACFIGQSKSAVLHTAQSKSVANFIGQSKSTLFCVDQSKSSPICSIDQSNTATSSTTNNESAWHQQNPSDDGAEMTSPTKQRMFLKSLSSETEKRAVRFGRNTDQLEEHRKRFQRTPTPFYRHEPQSEEEEEENS